MTGELISLGIIKKILNMFPFSKKISLSYQHINWGSSTVSLKWWKTL